MKLYLQRHFLSLSYDVRDFDRFVGSVFKVVCDDHLEARSFDKLLGLFYIGAYDRGGGNGGGGGGGRWWKWKWR